MTTILRTTILITAILALWLAFGFVAFRLAYFYVAIVAVVTLPALLWTRHRVWPSSAFLIAVSLMFALSPFDFTVQSTGKPQLAILPVSNGPACKPALHACHGCAVFPEQPSHAVVLSLK